MSLPKYQEIFDLHLKYVEYVVAKTLFMHQHLANITASGAGVETEVRQLLRQILPARFRVTHGYIVSSNGVSVPPSVSPQVDVLIVDTLVPHSLWTADVVTGMEIVPVESVVGALEVKRTLTARSTGEALNHLQRIRDAVSIRKDNPTAYLPGGVVIGQGLHGPYHSNPMLGIVGAIADPWLSNSPTERVRELVATAGSNAERELELDFLLSLDGTLVATIDESSAGNYKAYNPRLTHPCELGETSERTGHERRQAVAFGFGFMLAYVDKCCGRAADLEGYFFNQALGATQNARR